MYIFKLGNEILGICDEANLTECARDAWCYAFNSQQTNDVSICYLESNIIDDTFSYPTYEFDTYYEGGSQFLGLRLYGLGGEIDIPLDVKIIEED